jgi:hypothetical protein
LEDVDKVIEVVSQKWSRPIFLAGTSRGTISVSHAGATLQDRRVAGLILTASIAVGRARRRQLSLLDVSLERIRLPVLFVHHKEDGCWASKFDDALRVRGRVTASSRVAFVAVLGGDPPRSEPCQGLSPHGFLGKEREVVAAIADWMTGDPVPHQIGP